MDRNKIALCGGCFDCLHIAHIELLKSARDYASHVVVGINSDDYIRKTKGGCRPIFNEEERAEMLIALEYVDDVIVFREDNIANLILRIKPDYYIKGADWNGEKKLPQEEIDACNKVSCSLIYITHKYTDRITTTYINDSVQGDTKDGIQD